MIKVTEELRTSIRLKMLATRLPPRKLLKDRDGIPDGLNVEFITSFLDGELKQASSIIVAFLEGICEQEINKIKKRKNEKIEEKKKRKEIRAKKRQEKQTKYEAYQLSKGRENSINTYEEVSRSLCRKILREERRTGLSIEKVIKEAKADHLDIAHLYRVSRGKQKLARLTDIDDLLSLYATKESLEDKAKRKITIKSGYVPVKQDDINEIIVEIERTGVRPVKLLDMLELKNIRYYTINAWLNGQARSYKPEEVQAVLKAYQSLPTVSSSKPRKLIVEALDLDLISEDIKTLAQRLGKDYLH